MYTVKWPVQLMISVSDEIVELQEVTESRWYHIGGCKKEIRAPVVRVRSVEPGRLVRVYLPPRR